MRLTLPTGGQGATTADDVQRLSAEITHFARNSRFHFEHIECRGGAVERGGAPKANFLTLRIISLRKRPKSLAGRPALRICLKSHL